MELILGYRTTPIEFENECVVQRRGLQLLAELKQQLPVCMRATFEEDSCILKLSFLASSRLHYDLVCYVEVNLLTGSLVVRLGFCQERLLQCRTLQ